MIVRSEAVVLGGMDYGETSRIVTLLTREKGKISVLAKGARLTKSRFGASLQPMAYTQVQFYYKSTRGLQTLRESAHVKLFSGISRDLNKMGLGLRMVELVRALIQEEQVLPRVFGLLVEALKCLDEAPERAENVWPYFQLRLASMLGFAPRILREDVMALSGEGGRMMIETGEICGPATEGGIWASRAALRTFAVYARAPLDAVMRWPVTSDDRRAVDQLIEVYLRYHVEDAYPHRSDKVLAQLERFQTPPTTVSGS